MTPSVTRWSRISRRWECGILSKYLRISTSSTQRCLRTAMTPDSWFSAWCADRPGLKPYEHDRKSCSYNGLQHHRDCSLCDLVFECRDAERPLRTISLGDVDSAHWWRLIASGFDAFQEVPKVCLKVRFILLRRYAINARGPILAGPYVGLSHPFEVDDMV